MKSSNRIKFALSIAVLGLGVLGLAPKPALAATATATFIVSTSIQATCLISTTPLSFGTYTGTILASTSSVTIICNNGTHWDVNLNAGTASGATTTSRRMIGPAGALLSYGLFSDSAHATNWGSVVDVDAVEGIGTGSGQVLTVYGEVPAGQFFAAGLYADTITATVTY